MRKAVIAVEPVIPNFEPFTKPPKSFDSYGRLIKLFQKKGIIPTSSVASVIHSGLYMVPIAWYSENEDRFAEEAKNELETLCDGRFDFDFVKVLRAAASSKQYLVEQVNKYVNRMRGDLLVVLSTPRAGVPYWFLGSFAETAAFTASVPVLVLKPQAKVSDFSKNVRILVAVDAAASYSDREKGWFVEWAKSSSAHIDLVYVKPQRRKLLSKIRLPKDEHAAEDMLEGFASDLKADGVSVSLVVLKERDSVAEAIAEYAEKRKSWMIVAISTQRGPARKLLLGSTARRVLSLTKRPFLSLRLGKL
jgi:nucleotide-binding universal stress UspA family protein